MPVQRANEEQCTRIKSQFPSLAFNTSFFEITLLSFDQADLGGHVRDVEDLQALQFMLIDSSIKDAMAKLYGPCHWSRPGTYDNVDVFVFQTHSLLILAEMEANRHGTVWKIHPLHSNDLVRFQAKPSVSHYFPNPSGPEDVILTLEIIDFLEELAIELAFQHSAFKNELSHDCPRLFSLYEARLLSQSKPCSSAPLGGTKKTL